MLCPVCLQEGRETGTKVVDTNTSRKRPIIFRKRRCLSNARHILRTEEVVSKATLDNTYVRASSDHHIVGQFSPSHLREDIASAVLKRLSDQEIDSVTADVVARLSEDLPRIAEPLSPAEIDRFQPAAIASSISDYDIRTRVESRLRLISDRVAHVLYVLSFRGRVDVPRRDRSGFRNAGDFLAWFYSEDAYTDLTEAIPRQADRAVEEWWPPRPPRHPVNVIKATGAVKQFGFEQFRNSLLLALHGRHEAKPASLLTAQLVLFRLEGQATVRSSQLASEAMAALRMYDDIAYLRYAGIAKGYKSIRDFKAEAVALLDRPSPRIVYVKSALRPVLGAGSLRGRASSQPEGIRHRTGRSDPAPGEPGSSPSTGSCETGT